MTRKQTKHAYKFHAHSEYEDFKNDFPDEWHEVTGYYEKGEEFSSADI